MASGEWFTSRVSAVNIIPTIYPRAGPHKEKIRAYLPRIFNFLKGIL
jgi:hypothetical protein